MRIGKNILPLPAHRLYESAIYGPKYLLRKEWAS